MAGRHTEGADIVRDQTLKTQVSVAAAATATKELVDELIEAEKEEREPEIGEPIKKIAVALQDAGGSIDQAGKTVVTLQDGMGRPAVTPPQTEAALDAWRQKYTVMRKLIQRGQTWLTSQLPGLGGLVGGGGGGGDVIPWSASEIGATITAIIAALGASGYAGKKGLDRRKRKRRERDDCSARLAELDAVLARLRREMDPEKFRALLAKYPRLRDHFERVEFEQRHDGYDRGDSV